jgi:hypothetical protein
LDKEFEYLDNELFVVRFKSVVKRWLKIERSISKARYMAKNKYCLINIEPDYLVRFKVYWFKLETECYNPSLRFATKARGCKVVGQEGDPGVTSHAPGNAKSVRE